MLNRIEESAEAVGEIMARLGRQARTAAAPLAVADRGMKDRALRAMAASLRDRTSEILEANHADVEAGSDAGMAASFIDRLRLDAERVAAIASGLEAIAELDDPVGEVMTSWSRPNGLRIERVRTPLGVVGVIYESRPNVTADAGGLCLKAGNAVILRGGSDSHRSSAAIHSCLVDGLVDARLPEHAIQRVPTTGRAAVGEMLAGLDGAIDVIVPRGGRSLVERVQTEARVPVFAHLEGICHLYVDGSADLAMARSIALNAKMRRTGICGAMETLLVDRAVADSHLVPILNDLAEAGCELRGDVDVCTRFPVALPASEEDWRTEYLDAICSVRLVDGIDAAIDHVKRYSSHHTDGIVAENAMAVERYFNEIDSAILVHNASTQFADGGEFGMGAEIGIATGKMHARGPVGVEQLCSFNYRVRGSGQTRP